MAKTGELLSVAEAARVLGVKDRQVRNLIPHVLPAMMVGGSYVIRREDLAKVPKVRKPGPKPKDKPVRQRK